MHAILSLEAGDAGILFRSFKSDDVAPVPTSYAAVRLTMHVQRLLF